MDALRRTVETALGAAGRAVQRARQLTVRQIVLTLLETMQQFDVRTKLKQWIDAATQANDLEEVAEHTAYGLSCASCWMRWSSFSATRCSRRGILWMFSTPAGAVQSRTYPTHARPSACRLRRSHP